MNYLQVMKVTKKIICRQAPHALEESPAYVALALYVPSAAYVCNSVAVPLDAVVTTTIAEPSPKLTLVLATKGDRILQKAAHRRLPTKIS